MRPFRIVVAAHGDLAAAFVSAAQLICGRIDDLEAVGLDPTDSPESFAERLSAASGDSGTTLLILTDLVGGTPHNVSLSLTRRRPSAVVISGVNLAVLIEAATSTDALDADSQERLVALGRQERSSDASATPSVIKNRRSALPTCRTCESHWPSSWTPNGSPVEDSSLTVFVVERNKAISWPAPQYSSVAALGSHRTRNMVAKSPGNDISANRWLT